MAHVGKPLIALMICLSKGFPDPKNLCVAWGAVAAGKDWGESNPPSLPADLRDHRSARPAEVFSEWCLRGVRRRGLHSIELTNCVGRLAGGAIELGELGAALAPPRLDRADGLESRDARC